MWDENTTWGNHNHNVGERQYSRELKRGMKNINLKSCNGAGAKMISYIGR